MFENLLAKLAGKFAKSKLDLKEGPMDDTKKWYASKGVWTGIVTALMGAYLSLAPQFGWPAVPEWVFSFLGALGIYARVSADKQIS